MMNVIKKPLITEKNTILAASNTYAFEVDKKADKTEIKKAVEKAFGVKVVGVRTQNCRSRQKRVGTRLSRVQYWKKALVKVAAGDKIPLFEGA
jgi:large subunit ribosomal protein L23